VLSLCSVSVCEVVEKVWLELVKIWWGCFLGGAQPVHKTVKENKHREAIELDRGDIGLFYG